MNDQCRQCGDCCRNNGLIPPWLPDDPADEDTPEWLGVLVANLRDNFADVAEDYHCVFLTDDNRCAIHELKPNVCREFQCAELGVAHAASGCVSEFGGIGAGYDERPIARIANSG